MKHHLLGLAVAFLTFLVGLSIATVVLKPASESAVLPPVATHGETPSAWTILLSWRNHDLSQIGGPEKDQLRTAIDALRETQNQFLQPRLFSRVSTFFGDEKYVLVEESPLVYIPGDSRLQISVFDLNGKLLDSSEFGAGWRLMLSGMKFIREKDISSDVLEVKSGPSINGPDVGKQYYALVENKMRLIRLEDSKGTLHFNNYSSPNHTIGFTEVGRSADDWERSLITKDETQSLATLTWLGGYHLKVDEGTLPESWHEDPTEARLVEEVRARPGVKTIVNALKDANNPWLREAAQLAAEQMHVSTVTR